jgi:hypothetical protein
VAQVVECLPSKHEAPEFKPQYHKKKTKYKKQKKKPFVAQDEGPEFKPQYRKINK